MRDPEAVAVFRKFTERFPDAPDAPMRRELLAHLDALTAERDALTAALQAARENVAHRSIAAEARARRAESFKVDRAIHLGEADGDAAINVFLSADPVGRSYLLHVITNAGCDPADVVQEKIGRPACRGRDERRELAQIVRQCCDDCADLVADWGARRPGTSRLGKAIAKMVADAQRDRDVLDLAMDAQATHDRSRAEVARLRDRLNDITTERTP
jgi:hypothetical protein